MFSSVVYFNFYFPMRKKKKRKRGIKCLFSSMTKGKYWEQLKKIYRVGETCEGIYINICIAQPAFSIRETVPAGVFPIRNSVGQIDGEVSTGTGRQRGVTSPAAVQEGGHEAGCW